MNKETSWSVDQEHSEISFKVRHLMIAHVKGTFKVFDASIYTTGNDFGTAAVDLWIDAASINTGNDKRDEHLKAADFFDTVSHKQITFTSSTMGNPDEDGNRELWGDLTMKGITKNIKLNAQFGGFIIDFTGNEKAGFSVSGKIKRSDWGLTWNSAVANNGLMVGDEIHILCEMELTNAVAGEMVLQTEPASGSTIIY
jgi:polyisoprenoid-binding protein YceI